MKRPMLISIRGKSHEWSFPLVGDAADLAEWRADGLEVIELDAAIPEWAAACGLARPIAAMQAAWQWLRVW